MQTEKEVKITRLLSCSRPSCKPQKLTRSQFKDQVLKTPEPSMLNSTTTMASQNTSNMFPSEIALVQEEIKRLKQLQLLRAATASCSFSTPSGGTGFLPSTTVGAGASSGFCNELSNPSSNAMSGLNNRNGFNCQYTGMNSTAAAAASNKTSLCNNPTLASFLASQQQKQKQQEETRIMLHRHQRRLNTSNNGLRTPTTTMTTSMGSLTNAWPPYASTASTNKALSSALLTQQLQFQQQQQATVAPQGASISDQILANRGPFMRVGAIEPFPEKLHRMLVEVEQCGRGDVISFINSGRGFAIHKPGKHKDAVSSFRRKPCSNMPVAFHTTDTFFREIVPLYFRHSRLSSFKRQLNLYGFEQINIGPYRGGKSPFCCLGP